MLTLVTSNPAKYEPFAGQLAKLRISVEPPKQPMAELQSRAFDEALAEKSRIAANMFGRPVLVDDAGLVLEAYPGFPGPLTSTVLRGLGIDGLRRLLAGTSTRATMECHLGWWTGGQLRHWSGKVRGRVDPQRSVRDPKMLLSDVFVPDEPVNGQLLVHRARALAALEEDAFSLHLEANQAAAQAGSCDLRPTYDCPFCTELQQDGPSIFAAMVGDRLPSRIVYQDAHFVVMPPLGQFQEGGLLVLTREHILSLAHLRPELFDHLERLVSDICSTLQERYGVMPLVFEHGPAPEWGKGVCCVDHAHLNIFPAPVCVAPQLAGRMSLPVRSLSELSRLKAAEFGYLFVQENDGSRRVYDGEGVPTQLVRRIVTAAIGLPERWHWRDYPGIDELTATYRDLKGKIRL